MATTKEDIRSWLQRAKDRGATHVLVLCDTFDYSDFPQFAYSAEDAREKYDHPPGMHKIMEVYDLALDWNDQLNERRAFHL